MRREGRVYRRKRLGLRMMHSAYDNRLMHGVTCVESAERDDAAARGDRDADVAVEAEHGEVRRTRQKLKSASPSEDEGLCRAKPRQRFSLRSNEPLVFARGIGRVGLANSGAPCRSGPSPALSTPIALPPMPARIS